MVLVAFHSATWMTIFPTRKASQQGKGFLATEGINNVVFLYRFVIFTPSHRGYLRFFPMFQWDLRNPHQLVTNVCFFGLIIWKLGWGPEETSRTSRENAMDMEMYYIRLCLKNNLWIDMFSWSKTILVWGKTIEHGSPFGNQSCCNCLWNNFEGFPLSFGGIMTWVSACKKIRKLRFCFPRSVL